MCYLGGLKHCKNLAVRQVKIIYKRISKNDLRQSVNHSQNLILSISISNVHWYLQWLSSPFFTQCRSTSIYFPSNHKVLQPLSAHSHLAHLTDSWIWIDLIDTFKLLYRHWSLIKVIKVSPLLPVKAPHPSAML